METKRYYTVYLDGLANAEKASAFIGSRCYRGIYSGTKKVGQMERVLSDLVSVAYVAPCDVSAVLDALARIGFSGELVGVEMEEENGCFADAVPGSFFAVRV